MPHAEELEEEAHKVQKILPHQVEEEVQITEVEDVVLASLILNLLEEEGNHLLILELLSVIIGPMDKLVLMEQNVGSCTNSPPSTRGWKSQPDKSYNTEAEEKKKFYFFFFTSINNFGSKNNREGLYFPPSHLDKIKN